MKEQFIIGELSTECIFDSGIEQMMIEVFKQWEVKDTYEEAVEYIRDYFDKPGKDSTRLHIKKVFVKS